METTLVLEDLVSAVISNLEAAGYAAYTIRFHRRSYRKLLEYAHAKGITCYSLGLINEYMESHSNLFNTYSKKYKMNLAVAYYKLEDVAKGVEIGRRHYYIAPLPSSCFDPILQDFQQCLQTEKRRNEVRTHLLCASAFLKAVEEAKVKDLGELGIDSISSIYGSIRECQLYGSKLRTFLKFAHKHGYMENDFSFFVPRSPIKKIVPTVYSQDEIEKCLSCIDRGTISGKRNYAGLLLSARLGLRSSDVCGLEFSHIDRGKKQLNFVQKKTGRPLSLPFLPEIEMAIDDYLQVRPKSDAPQIFLQATAPYLPLRQTSLNYALIRALKAAGIKTEGKKRGPHALRSSLASSMLKEGVSYPVIQQALGHANPNTTRYYTSIDFDKLKDCAIEVPHASGKFANLLGEGVENSASI